MRGALAARADPDRAARMRDYMKSSMPYRGVPAPSRKEALRDAFSARPIVGRAAWKATVLALWRGARFREERYAAIALAGDRRSRKHAVSVDALPVYEELITDGAWWDLVDDVAIHRIGPLLGEHPRVLRPAVLRWSRDPDRWLRRCAIICQIGAKADTDATLLYAAIAPNIADRDFFIRKAIGWALRERSKTHPAEVRRYVREHEGELSGLSRREALASLERC